LHRTAGSILLTRRYNQVITAVYKSKSQVAGIEKTLNNYPYLVSTYKWACILIRGIHIIPMFLLI